MKIAIVGAGPVGLEAALRAITDGFDVQVFEAGTIAENVRRWGFVRLFSPFEMNSSEQGRGTVADCFPQLSLPSNDAILTGAKYRDQYLVPLSRLPVLKKRIRENSLVISVGREYLTKGEQVGQTQRGNNRFRLLMETPSGEETHFADVVLDCTGTYGTHRWVGAGGMPCLGERATLAANDYLIPDVESAASDRFSHKTTLVIGSGYSAATTVVALSKLAEDSSDTKTIWITRRKTDAPMTRIENDSLKERDQLAQHANELVCSSNSAVQWISNGSILKIERTKDHKYRTLVRIETNEDEFQRELVVDEVVANVGYKPHRSIYEELQIHNCYATQGPMNLAAVLMGETSNDCLTQSSQGVETLCNPEPNFYILGAKSYGRDSRFLIRTGLEQIDELFCWMAEKRKTGSER